MGSWVRAPAGSRKSQPNTGKERITSAMKYCRCFFIAASACQCRRCVPNRGRCQPAAPDRPSGYHLSLFPPRMPGKRFFPDSTLLRPFPSCHDRPGIVPSGTIPGRYGGHTRYDTVNNRGTVYSNIPLPQPTFSSALPNRRCDIPAGHVPANRNRPSFAFSGSIRTSDCRSRTSPSGRKKRQ